MSALTKDRDTLYKEGVEEELPMAASAKVYGGSMVCTNASGYAAPGADTANFMFAGVACAEADNSAGANGAINVKIKRKGVFLFAASGMTAADVGKTVYVLDDQTVALAAGTMNDIPAGKIVKVESATAVWVDIDQR